jgi:hypothetical protein
MIAKSKLIKINDHLLCIRATAKVHKVRNITMTSTMKITIRMTHHRHLRSVALHINLRVLSRMLGITEDHIVKV